MGNLGYYQLLTTVAKKVGGPVVLIVGTAATGWAVGRVAEAGGKKAVKVAKSKQTRGNANVPESDPIFTIHTDGDASSQLKLHVGAQYRVLERDENAVLIEVLGNTDNPYFVSSEILSRLSDFPEAKDAKSE